MNTVFSINGIEGNADYLLCEVGESYCCLAEANENGIQSLQYISLNDHEDISGVLSSKDYKKIFISSAFPRAMLVPHRFYNSISHAVLTEDEQTQFYDVVPEWQIMTLYWLPDKFVESLRHKFKNISFLHTYTTVLKTGLGEASDTINIFFTPKTFRVLVKKQGQLLLAQTYQYVTPLDVVYFLLKICYEFGLSQEETILKISGLIEKDSSLYKELYNYFMHVGFAENEFELTKEYPSHFFTSIYNLAACVL